MSTTTDNTRDKIDREIQRVDNLLRECDKRRLDPCKLIEAGLKRHDKRRGAAQKE